MLWFVYFTGKSVMQVRLWLIRHGEREQYAGDVSKIQLTEKGHRQADLLGKRLKDENIEIIYSSTMCRARQTAADIDKYLNVKIKYRDELKEIDLGDFDRNGWEYFCANFSNFKNELIKNETDIPFPNGECGTDAWLRASKVLNEIVHLNLKNIVISTHGGLIKSIICGVLGLPQGKRNLFGYPLEHCSITRLIYDTNRYFLDIFNDYTHLGSEL
jgi:broad specificity phosphatase PhoE